MHRTSLHKYLLISVLGFLSCSSPTSPSKAHLLERLIADLPLTPPVQTSANESDPGFIFISGYFHAITSNRTHALRKRIEPFLAEGIRPEIYGSTYVWRRWIDIGTPGEVVVTVTQGEVLSFRIEWPSIVEMVYEGWISLDNDIGYLSADNGTEEWCWGPVTFGYRLEMWSQQNLTGPEVVIADSTYGGGYYIHRYNSNIITEGHWDSFGHGSWWTKNTGSGSW
jgi:hypothetical protein